MTLSLFQERVDQIKNLFCTCSTPELRYKKIIELGSTLPLFPEEEKIEKNLVSGCQSELYLTASLKNDLFLFNAHSEALISKGLAAILYLVYNELPPLVILKEPPTFFKELNITSSLSPSRSNGLMHIYLKMQQLALLFLAHPSKV